jgi:hypothetical protein
MNRKYVVELTKGERERLLKLLSAGTGRPVALRVVAQS